MSETENAKIVITRDGPYEVTGDVPIVQAIIGADEDGVSEEWLAGKTYENPTPGLPVKLCRCGHSRDKPFCDGTHEDAGFCGREKADRPPYAENATLQKGEKISLLDDESLCVSARFCDRGITVWGAVEKSHEEENVALAIQEACACPGGRLTILDENGDMIERVLPMEISPVDDPVANFRGPLWVKGGIPVEGRNGEQYETRNRVALCRCGESRNMPYCDATHYRCEHMEGIDK